MGRKGRIVLIPALALLLVVFSAAFFLGRQTVSHPISVELSREPAVQPVRTLPAETVPLKELPVEDADTDGLIDLNTATKEELMTLPRVGEVLAERILEYRQTYGRFSAPEQIMDVEGIGQATYDGFADMITIGD